MAATQQDLDAIRAKKRLEDSSFGDGSLCVRKIHLSKVRPKTL
jgi:hypothetical protein